MRRAAAITAPVFLLALATMATATSTAQARTGQAAANSQVALTPAAARALSASVTDKVIVVFKNQLSGLPDTPANSVARSGAVRSLQENVLAELAATHARSVRSISLVNAVAATVSPATAKLLAANPAVAEVVQDLPIPVANAAPAVHPARAALPKPLPGACAPKGQVQLDPQAIESINAASVKGGPPSAQSLGYTGAGVKVAWLADGIDINNPDFIRSNGTHVFVDYQDFSGGGTNAQTDGGEAFLDASSIAAQGRHVYNIASYAGLPVPCDIRILGVAPGASLVGLDVFGGTGEVFNSVFLEAVDYAVTRDHVNVINESFGNNPFPDETSLDLTDEANDAAVKAGVTVDVASGDAGPTNTIGSPATDPNVISAGATTTYRAYAQTGIGGITVPGVKGWVNNNISGLSSGGFDQQGGTVDVVAPGDLNWALCTPNLNKYFACSNFSGAPAPVELQGGTSEAAPLTSGVAALVIQAYREAHHGRTPSPAIVKQIISSTAQDIDAPAEQQGAGMIDAYQAVLAARSYHGTTVKPAGQAVLASATQLNVVGQPASTRAFTEKLTNDGAARVTLDLSSRTLSPYKPVLSRSLTLTSASGYTTKVPFTVPSRQNRLSVSVALVGGVNLSLISPSGYLAEYNNPQGLGSNYGNAQVANPAPGKWTAVISSFGIGGPLPAKFQASTATWQPFGHLSARSMTLAPGASGTVLFTVSTPRQAGDESGSIVVHSSAAAPGFTRVTSIPVTLRSLVPTPAPATTVTGTLTGGNGRRGNTGQTAYYQVQIPSGLPALNVSVNTGNAANLMFAELVDPAGGAVSVGDNQMLVTTAFGPEIKPEVGSQLHVVRPSPGRWTLVVDFYGMVSGTAVSQPFRITFNDTPVTASETGLPDSAGTKLAAGTPRTAFVSVTNSGTTPEAYFVDARTSSQATVSLAPQTTSSLTLPDLFGQVPIYLVPSHTSAIKATVSASARLFFDVTYPFGDPDLISTTGKTATRSYSAAQVPAGAWTVTPVLVGPTGGNPAPDVTAKVSMTATMTGFDPTVSSPTGDLWQDSTDPTAAVTPFVVNPGKSVVIPVTITPKGTAGTTVSGTIYLSDSSFIDGAVTFYGLGGLFGAGSDVAAFHYTYTIG